MTDQPTNPTPNPDSDDAIRVSDDLAQHPRLKSILSPASEPLLLGTRVIMIKSFPNDHDLGLGDLGRVGYIEGEPDLFSTPGVIFDRAPYVCIKNPVMGHSIWEYVREVTKSPDPDPIPTDDPNFQQALEDMSGIPAWKRPLLEAKARHEAAKAEAERERIEAHQKLVKNSKQWVVNALRSFGITLQTSDVEYSDILGKAYWSPTPDVYLHASYTPQFGNGKGHYSIDVYSGYQNLVAARRCTIITGDFKGATDAQRVDLLNVIESLEALQTLPEPHDMANDPEDESDLPFSDPEEA